MKEIVIISGKGGTGKTSIVAAFATIAQKKILCDADVDAADLHLIMEPEVKNRTDFQSGFTADIDKAKCSTCGFGGLQDADWKAHQTVIFFLTIFFVFDRIERK